MMSITFSNFNCVTLFKLFTSHPRRLYLRKKSNLASLENYSILVGLEVHAQINATSKLFSRSPHEYLGSPNSYVSLFDASIPGALPIINRYCVESAIKSGLALNCTINEKCFFDRKHYFYPDSPNGFQITQKHEPIATNGYITFFLPKTKNRESELKRVHLKQVQLEQDTGKMLKDIKTGAAFIDLNRCGVGLMEFVFEPELYNHTEAIYLVKELIHILKRIDTCSCKMEEGSLRVDANVSVSPVNGPIGNRIELKNLNSLFSLNRGLEYEVARHLEALEKGLLVPSETRFFDPVRKKTFPMREKDNVEDYRYIPEPNLPPLRLSQDEVDVKNSANGHASSDQVISISAIRQTMPSLPEIERDRLIEVYKLSLEVAHLITENDLFPFFCAVIDLNPIHPVSKIGSFIGRELTAILNDNQVSIESSNLTPHHVLDTFDLIEKGVISYNVAQDVINLIIIGDSRDIRTIVKELGWWLTQNEKVITENCLKVVNSNPIAVYNAKRGKSYSLDWLVDQVFKQTNLKSTRNIARANIKLILDGRDLKDLKKAALKVDKQNKSEDSYLFSSKESKEFD